MTNKIAQPGLQNLSVGKPPKQLWKYFWDVDPASLEPSRNFLFIIQRLLNQGDEKAVRWVRRNFNESQIRQTFEKMRDFNPRVANFWRIILDIPLEKVLCLQAPYLTMRKRHWVY